HGPDRALGFYALDARTGRTLWKSSRISELVATNDGLVGVIDRAVVGLDASRPPRPRWRFTVPPSGAGRDVGPIAQPLVADEKRVYVVGGNKRVYALDAATGRTMWTSDPLVQEYTRLGAGGGGVYFVDDDRSLHALDAATGTPRWSADDTRCASRFDCAIPAATPPVVGDGQVFFPAIDETMLIGFDPTTGRRTSMIPAPSEQPASVRSLADAGTASFEMGVVTAHDKGGRTLWSRSFGIHELRFEQPEAPDVIYLTVSPPPPPED
ncbi:MAG: PQQ-like beta-propeller repeat protein, partial [Actinobacteria bacterium]|nr:PQQ-like beta-propeller repeat protein [Actinomycetota bacterium]